MASNDKEKSSVQLPVIIGAGVAVVILVGWLGHKFLAPPVAAVTTQEQTRDALYAKVAKEAGPNVDLSKVPEPDRTKFLASIGAAPRAPEEILKTWIKAHGGK